MKDWAVVVIASAILLTLIMGAVIENANKTQMAKNGLEECLANPNSWSSRTIWVKSCKEYMNTMRNNNE